ncbi:MAG TPA: CARDB domain-containing protein [Thermoleophilaceae bacterium]|nr:CARDB domain-containing protein [Thermoleophilaceae bacterium]
MRIRLPVAILIAASLAVPAAASARGSAAVHLKSCQTGAEARDRQATFKAWMHEVSGTKRMAVRFELVAQKPGRSAQRVEGLDALETWHRSRKGVTRYAYSQTVKRLARGTSYRMVVRYRWYDADGDIIKRAKRTSAECVQEGDLPNLIIPAVAITSDGAPSYIVTVKNKGKALAENFTVTLTIDGALVDERTIERLEAGQKVFVEFNGPPCLHVLAIADSEETVIENNEKDNSFSSDCLAAGDSPR